MPRTSRQIFELSRSAPNARQQLTAGSADFSVSWTAGLLAALASRTLFATGSAAPLMVLLSVSIVVLVLDMVVLAGWTGQSVGARVAQTADVSSSTGRPVGIVVMAQALGAGGASRDPRLTRISLAARA